MASQREVRNRISSFRNIQKITRAMKMVAGARLAFECRTLATFDFDPARFLDRKIVDQYPQRDFHRAFVGQVMAAFTA